MQKLIKDVDGKTIVQVKVPVCMTIQMDDVDAKDMTQSELCGIIDEAIDQVDLATGARVAELHARHCMNRTPVKFTVERYWDELPIDELEITMQDDGVFEKRGDKEDD